MTKRTVVKACGVSASGATEVALLDLREPPQPDAGQVLVAVEAAGVGAWDRLLNTGGWDVGLRPPAALGVEGVGRIRAVGPVLVQWRHARLRQAAAEPERDTEIAAQVQGRQFGQPVGKAEGHAQRGHHGGRQARIGCGRCRR
ncbi:alcohol dehydrogenase catalytic domain-containing protein [Streptomyces lasalocidi]